ncbi:transposase [Solwaraspora sp. WMMA2101]|uniref:transposase n=1 Tax=Solwaraspora sp. WMMA2101 TaxID=3404124 RepID=UPI003B92A455
MSEQRRRYSPQFKAEAVQMVVETGRPIAAVARDLEVHEATLGKVANCQIGVSVHAGVDTASRPLDWRLFLPVLWDGDAVDEANRAEVTARRGRCQILEGEHHRPKRALVVEMLDELAEHRLRPPLVPADAGYGDNSQFRSTLDRLEIGYIMRVDGGALATSRMYGRSSGCVPAWRTVLKPHLAASGVTLGREGDTFQACSVVTWCEIPRRPKSPRRSRRC